MRFLVNPDKDDPQKVVATIMFWIEQKTNNSNPGQKKLPNNQQEGSVCSECGKTVDQKVVNFCKHQFNGTIFCRECQEGK